MKRIKIKFDGGFHNSSPMVISVPLYFYAANRYPHYLSLRQKRKLQKHFCGIKSCTCGGAARAEKEELNYRLVPV
jgi:hypothetical protein